jgi:hypothetical protein
MKAHSNSRKTRKGSSLRRMGRPLTITQRANNVVARLAEVGINFYMPHAWVAAARVIENELRSHGRKRPTEKLSD